MKIHCIESQKEGFDKIPMKEIREMVGWIEPPNEDGTSETWDVTLADECYFACKTQENAQLMATQEEIKYMLMKK